MKIFFLILFGTLFFSISEHVFMIKEPAYYVFFGSIYGMVSTLISVRK